MTGYARCARVARPTHPRPSALVLLDEAHARLNEATGLDDPLDRYAAAHLAALRAAAAVLAARGSPTAPSSRRRRPVSAWAVLPELAPELAEWAAHFAAGARRRAAAEAGVYGAATGAQADDLVADVGVFLAVVETTLDLAPRLVAGRITGRTRAG